MATEQAVSLDQLGTLVEDGANDLYQVEATLQAMEMVVDALESNHDTKYNKAALSAFVGYAARNMATLTRGISETLSDLGFSVRQFEKIAAIQENRLSPSECARLVETISGGKPILNEDMGALTLRLRACAGANPAMGVLRDAWESAITRAGGLPIAENVNGFHIQFDRVQMRAEV